MTEIDLPKAAKKKKTARITSDKNVIELRTIRVINDKAVIAPVGKEALIKGGTVDSTRYKCHFAADHPHITLADLNADAEYALRGRTFPSLQLDQAKKYQKENPGSFITTISNYHNCDVADPPKSEDGKKAASFGVPKEGAEKYITAYLVTTPNKRDESKKQMFDTSGLVKK